MSRCGVTARTPGSWKDQMSGHPTPSAMQLTQGPYGSPPPVPKRAQPFDVKRGHKAQVSIHYRRLFERAEVAVPFSMLAENGPLAPS